MPGFREKFRDFWEIWNSGPGTSFRRSNFLSGSTPPNSAKRNRLTRSPQKKKFGNPGQKKIEPKKRELFFFACFLDVVFGRLWENHEVKFPFFFFPEPGEAIHSGLARNQPNYFF